MKRKFLDLTDNHLKNNPYLYDEDQLIYTLQTYCPSFRVLNRYQKLSAYLCAKYVIFGGNNEKYGDCTEDMWLDDNDILRKQKHITRDELSEAHDFVSIEEDNELNELDLMAKNDFNILKN